MTGTNDDAEPRVVTRTICDEDHDPVYALVAAVAELKGVDERELTQLQRCVDNLVELFYRAAPAAEANAQLTFTYEGIWITLFPDGQARFVIH